VRRPRLNGLALRFALASLASSVLALVVVATGVLWVGGSIFEHLMLANGASSDDSRAMFSESVTRVVVVASLVALLASVVLAALAGRAINRPLATVAQAARRVGEGAYGSRVPRPTVPELASLADSFNQMAAGLEDQERLRRELIENFGHELRTPLTNLYGYLHALREGVIEPSPEIFASLHEEVDRLRRLSSSLDALAAEGRGARLEAGEVDLVRVVDAVLELSRPAFERRDVRVERDLPAALSVHANPDHLAQVVMNLFQNAVRYTPVRGRVTLSARSEAGSVLFSIVNTGDEIPAEDLSHLFERFYRLEKSRDRAHGGAGIGLAIVKQLIESAGGRVGVDSAAGLVRFWFSLPA
jgi:signal transduction histidine kinase